MKIMKCLIIISLLSGCATTKDSIITGAAIGSLTGTVLGHQKEHSSRARLTGGAIGLALGGLLGYFGTKKVVAKKKERKSKPLPNHPFLTKPKVRMYWVPNSIEANKFVEKHRVWVIESNSSWTK